ncbi:MAG: sodium/solute symporter [Planctomycetia bacterium]|nr:sodium/solute symporter [Planctomycetia bacterium]
MKYRNSRSRSLSGGNGFTGDSMQLTTLDLVLIGLYIALVVWLGCRAGFVRRKGESRGTQYFLGGNSLTWPMIGLAMFAANISTVHLVSFAESGYRYGLAYGNFEWMAAFTLILLSLFFAPLYLRSQVATLPDFLERRYNRSCRNWLAVLSIFSAIVVHNGAALYTAAIVLRGIFGFTDTSTIFGMDATFFAILLLGGLTGLYTIIGGLLAVVWTESVQTILLLVGAVCILFSGLSHLGGWDALCATLATQPHPLYQAGGAANADIVESTANFLHICRPSYEPDNPWGSLFLGQTSDSAGLSWIAVLIGYPVLGIWFWCCDQTIVQRVLGAKDERHARLGPLFCAAIKVLPVFLFVLPGTVCVALVQNGAFDGAAPESAKECFTFMIDHLLPVGVKGLVVVALLAAAMSTCSASLNSMATLFVYDIIRRHTPQTTDVQSVRYGRLVTVLGMILAIGVSPLFGAYPTIYQGIQSLISFAAPPITAVFLAGVFTRKTSGKAAFLTLVIGAMVGCAMFGFDLWQQSQKVTYLNFMYGAFYLLLLCFGMLYVFSRVWPQPLPATAERLVWTSWREPLRGTGAVWYADYRFWTIVVLLLFVTLYAIFW